MKEVKEDPEREARIDYEVVVDAYNEEERAMGWYYYLEGKIEFPFTGEATEAALTSYVATQELDEDLLESSHRAFAFCYIGSHFGLDLVNASQASKIIDYVFEHEDRFLDLIGDE